MGKTATVASTCHSLPMQLPDPDPIDKNVQVKMQVQQGKMESLQALCFQHITSRTINLRHNKLSITSDIWGKFLQSHNTRK